VHNAWKPPLKPLKPRPGGSLWQASEIPSHNDRYAFGPLPSADGHFPPCHVNNTRKKACLLGRASARKESSVAKSLIIFIITSAVRAGRWRPQSPMTFTRPTQESDNIGSHPIYLYLSLKMAHAIARRNCTRKTWTGLHHLRKRKTLKSVPFVSTHPITTVLL